MAKKKWFWLIYVVFAVYLVNKAFAYVAIPEGFLPVEKWILVIAAALLLLGAYSSYKSGKAGYEYR
jgi:hypothetical protein